MGAIIFQSEAPKRAESHQCGREKPAGDALERLRESLAGLHVCSANAAPQIDGITSEMLTGPPPIPPQSPH